MPPLWRLPMLGWPSERENRSISKPPMCWSRRRPEGHHRNDRLGAPSATDLDAEPLFSVFITVTLVFAVVQQWYDQLWVGVLIHELSVVVVILNGARLAQNGQSFKLLKETMKSMVQDTRIAFASFKARYIPARG